jgi:hypothetical protein
VILKSGIGYERGKGSFVVKPDSSGNYMIQAQGSSSSICDASAISGARTESLVLDYVVEHCATQRLAAIIIWRRVDLGRPRQASDSVSSASIGRHQQSAMGPSWEGGKTPDFYWAANWDSHDRRLLLVRGNEARVDTLGVIGAGRSDSVLVVLVDDINGRSGQPRLVAVIRAAPALVGPLRPPTDDEIISGRVPPSDPGAVIRRLLDASPVATAFLRGGSPPPG